MRPSVMVNASQGPAGETSKPTSDMHAWKKSHLRCQIEVSSVRFNSHVAPALAADASMVGRFQLLIVSKTPSSSSPLVVKPVTRRLDMIDLPVLGSMIPGKMAPPWQLRWQLVMDFVIGMIGGEGPIHGGDDTPVEVHLRGNALQTLGVGVVDQGGMTG